MKKSEIKAMNRSFSILGERRAKMLDDERTIRLQEHVKEIRKYSIKNMDVLVEKAVKNLENNGVEVILAEKSENALDGIIFYCQGRIDGCKVKIKYCRRDWTLRIP